MGLERMIGSGNISRKAFLAGLLAAPLLASCSKEQNKSQDISEKLQDEWPIWSNTDLELNKYRGPVLSYDKTLNLKPNFYDGPMPLEYQGKSTLTVGPLTDSSRVLQEKFEGFSNYFIYDLHGLIGVVSVDDNNTLVAEARIDIFNLGDGAYSPNAAVEEFHYSGGLLVFHCTSDFEKSSGIKMQEHDVSGRKERDYYFVLPMGFSE